MNTLRGLDNATGRPCVLAKYGEWGYYVKDKSQPIRYVVQAPHPVADENTERIALEIWRQVPGCLLMVAGAHRQAGGPGENQGLADVPWNEGSMFHQVARHHIHLPQLQIHGFSNSTAPDHDIVLSSGSATALRMAKKIADALESAGFRVARVWEGFDILTAVGNKQSVAAEGRSTFVHMEINRTVRMTALSRRLVAAVSACLNYGFEQKFGINYGIGQLPVNKIEADLNFLRQHFDYIRITYPAYNSSSVPYWQDICERARNKGFGVMWGITCPYGGNFNAFIETFISLAPWAGGNNILYGVNEEAYHNDGSISDAQIFTLLSEAAAVIKGGPTPPQTIISAAGDGELDQLIAHGRGAFDYVGLNQYGSLDEFRTNVNKLFNAFGHHGLITEFNTGRGFDPDFGNEQGWKNEIKARSAYVGLLELPKFFLYTYDHNAEKTPSGAFKWNFRTGTDTHHEAFNLFML